MVEITRMPGGYAYGFTFSKEITEDDLKKAVGEIDLALESNQKINLLCDLTDLGSVTPRALLKDLLYGISSLGRLYRFERVAVVTDSAAVGTLVELEKHLFPHLRLKGFPSLDRQHAQSWVECPIEPTPSGLVLTESPEGNAILVEVRGAVTGHDVRRLCQAVRFRYESSGPANLLLVLDSRPRGGSGLLYEQLHSLEVLTLIGKFAVVAPPWGQSWVEALTLTVRARLRYFPPDGISEARRWLSDRTPAVYLYPLVKGHLVITRLVGKLTTLEARQLYEMLTPMLGQEGGIDLLLEVPYEEGMTLAGALEVMKLAVEHRRELARAIRRLAVITDSRWVSRLARAEQLLLPGIPERSFPFSQRDLAENWLCEGRETLDDLEALATIAAWDSKLYSAS